MTGLTKLKNCKMCKSQELRGYSHPMCSNHRFNKLSKNNSNKCPLISSD